MSSTPNPGVYPGNPSLPREVKEKILSTFRHTLNLFHEGKIDDCLIGCDFILKMDSRFAPARQLMDKARNPNADIDIAQLEAIVATTPTRQERVVAADPDRLLVRAVESFNARDFDAAITAAEQVLAVLPGNQDALEILDKSQRKKAAQPVFDGSRKRALAALEADRRDDARRELDKMRDLDPDHPAVALLERRIGPSPAGGAAPLPPAAPPADFGGLSFDGADTGKFAAGGMEEPDIQFDNGATVALKMPSSVPAPPPPPDFGGLDALSLDSLSLDLPPSVGPLTPPTPDARSGLGGPLQQRSVPAPPPAPQARAQAQAPPRPAAPPPPPPAPATAPGSPADMWGGDGGGELDLEDMPADSGVDTGLPPPPPSPHATLQPEPSREPDPEAAEREIAGLLRQGDEAARRGERQQAIEIWSRIFLIDINNSEAVTRIEKARQDMAEGNRLISDGLKSGREAYEGGDLPGARELFLQVLAVDENEPTARFYLDRIEEEMTGGGGGQPRADETDGFGPETATPPGDGKAASPAMSASAARTAAAKRTIRLPATKVAGVLGAFLAITLALVYFFVFRAPKPGGGGKASTAAAGATPKGSGSLAHARELLGNGKIGEARIELRRIPPGSPERAEADRMLADLGKPGSGVAEPATQTETSTSVSVVSPPAGSAAPVVDPEPARIRLAAERALADKRYIEALKNFSQAAPAFRNDPTFAQSMGVASEKVTLLTPAVKLYNEGEYETAIPVLWRIHQEDRDNKDARQYLLRSYFNQGVTQLQNGQYQKSIQSMNEALGLDPADAEAARHKKFAERYQKSDLDLMGRIYVRHLNRRP